VIWENPGGLTARSETDAAGARGAGAGYWWVLDNSFGLDDFGFVAPLVTGHSTEALRAFWVGLVTIRPLGHLLFYANYWIWGTWAGGYHLTNVLLHLLMAGWWRWSSGQCGRPSRAPPGACS
jgi:hypothetical protein